MPLASVLLLFCGLASAQDASTATAVSSATVAASSATAVAVSSAPAAAAPVRALFVRIHQESADWEPVSVKAGGDAQMARDHFSRLVAKARVKGKSVWLGRSAAVTAKARLYPAKDDHMLVVSIFPKGKSLPGLHLEFRFLISEGYLDEAKVAAIHCKDPAGAGLDTYELSEKGLDYREDFPGSGKLSISAISAKPGKRSWNAAELSRAEFADPDLGVVDAGFSVRGLASKR